MTRRRKTGIALPKRRKWRLLRVSMRTHEMLKNLKAHTDVPMLEFVERVVTYIYGGGLMSLQALTFYLIYCDAKPTYIVAAKDAATAETGLRATLLGQGVKTIKAISVMEAEEHDLGRIGLTAVMSQLTQISAMLQMLLGQKGKPGLVH